MIFVGTSGWQYDDWRGRFYPRDLPKRRWLEFYASRFSIVEVNNTFYRLPEEETFVRWRKETPDDFVVAPKASRYITHLRRLRDCRDAVDLFLSRARGLGAKLGPMLFQLPPRFPADPARLKDFVALLPKAPRSAFEFRDRSWEDDEVYRILDDAGVALVLADRPGTRVPDVVTGGWSYVRFHQGTPASPEYRRSKLRRWAGRIAGLPAHDVFAFFNNDAGGAAPRDAAALVGLLEKRGMDVKAGAGRSADGPP